MTEPVAGFEMTFELVALAGALLLSALFSGSETALTSLTEAKCRMLIEKHPRRNKLLSYWLKRPNQILTTVLIGNNIVNAFTAALATLVAQQYFSSSVLSFAVGTSTIAILVFGEITPKTFAKHNAERVAPTVLYVLVPLYYLIFPATWFFSKLSQLLVRAIGGKVSRSGPSVTEEYLSYVVQLGQEEGVLEEHEEELITSVLDFSDTVVKEVMVPRTEIEAISIDASLEDVRVRARESGHTRMPVYEENLDEIRGVFHSRALLHVKPDSVFDLSAELHEAIFVPELMKISELMKIFQQKKSHLAVVVDEYGGCAGIVSLEDVIEELIGEIRDEYDEDEPDEIRQIDEDRFVALGKANISALEHILDTKFPPQGDFETLGGFLIHQVGKMPSVGDRISFSGWLFVVTNADQRKVERAEIIRINAVPRERVVLPPRVPEENPIRLVK